LLTNLALPASPASQTKTNTSDTHSDLTQASRRSITKIAKGELGGIIQGSAEIASSAAPEQTPGNNAKLKM
jgi:hypothetical protein